MAPLDPQQLHDLKTVHFDFKSICKLLKSGYRFDDENAERIIQQLEKAVLTLEQELTKLEKLR